MSGWTQGVMERSDFSVDFIKLMEDNEKSKGMRFDGITWYPEDQAKNEFMAMYGDPETGIMTHLARYKIGGKAE